jgi:hypothetical protein
MIPSMAFSTSFTKAMPLRRRDEWLGSHDNKSVAGAGLESYLLYSTMRQLLMQSRLLQKQRCIKCKFVQEH